jgi:DNA polymerase-3 subunit delta'
MLLAMDRILGQPRAIETLRRALHSGRMHHAWIFAGPRGVGKFTTALELAKVLLDPQASTDTLEHDPQGETAALIDAGSHPDLHVIRKELAVYSDDARLRTRKLLTLPLDVLRERMIGGQTGDGKYHEPAVFKTPALGHSKVFIIDEAELLADAAQNALLKTLEEPPPGTYIFLITTHPQRLLATIHSRCQTVTFGALDEQAMRTWLERADLQIDERDRVWIERFCAGSPGLAQLAAEHGFARWQETLAPMLDALAGGDFPAPMGQALAELIEAFATKWVAVHENASKEAANHYVFAILAAEARTRLHEAVSTGGDTGAPLRAIELIRSAEYQLERHVNLKLVLENLVAQWAAQPA